MTARQRAQLRRARGAAAHRGLPRARGVPAPARSRAWPSSGSSARNLKGYGCAGLSNVAYGLIMQELEAGDSGLRSMALGAGLARDVRHLALGERGAEAALAARDGGRARHRLLRAHRARPRLRSRAAWRRARAATATDWILSGTKRWITNGSIADVAVVWAKDGETIRGFLVERGTPGFSTHDIKGKFSLRASITSELVLEDVRVPASAHPARGARGSAARSRA